MSIPCKKTASAADIAKLFIKHWITNGYGVPKVITSDRDTKFTGAIWQTILKDLQIKQQMGAARHQQTNGQAENAIKLIKRTARKFADYAHNTGDEWLHIIIFAINDYESVTTGFTPFYLTLGFHPRSVPNHDHIPPVEEPEIIVDQQGREHKYFKLAKILDHRFKHRKLQLLVFYEGYSDEDAEWVNYSAEDTSWDDDGDRALATNYMKKHGIIERRKNFIGENE
jgi:transposase InsO family protein